MMLFEGDFKIVSTFRSMRLFVLMNFFFFVELNCIGLLCFSICRVLNMFVVDNFVLMCIGILEVIVVFIVSAIFASGNVE